MRKSFLILIIVVVAAFSRSLISGYLQWDDNVFIQENSLLQWPWWDFFKQVWSHSFFGDFLPLTLMSYWLEIQSFGFSAQAQHAVNLLLHLFNVVVLYQILLKIPNAKKKALALTVIFALHPLQTEVVLWISERKSLLAIFFALCAWWASEKAESSEKKKIWFGLYWFCFALSLLSKATALLLPVALICKDRWLLRKPSSSMIRKHAIPLFMALIWGVVRVWAYSVSVDKVGEVAWSPDHLLSLPAQILAALGFYTAKFFLPIQQSAIYPPYQAISENGFWILSAIALLASFLWIWWKKRDGWILFFLVWIGLFLLPVLQIVPRLNFVNDRYFYFPSIGFAGLLAFSFPHFFQRKSLVLTLAVLLGALTWSRSEVWQSNESLWLDTVEKNPGSGIAQNNLGLEYFKQKRFTEAARHLQIATEVGLADSTSHLAWNNLGLMYLSPENPKERNLQKAEEAFLQSIRLSPQDSASTRYNLALVYLQEQRREEARQVFLSLQESLSSKPDARYESLLQLIRQQLQRL